MGKRLDDKQLAAAVVELRHAQKEHAEHDANVTKTGKRIAELKAKIQAEIGDGIPF